MLVLTRKHSESIKIGNDIVIVVTQISPGKVKLGIQAPAHVRILRAELTEREIRLTTAADTGENVMSIAKDEDGDSMSDDESMSDGESPVDFSTEYAVEVEEQMLCLAAF